MEIFFNLSEITNLKTAAQLTEIIAQYEREFKAWENRVEKIIKRYLDERKATAQTSRFNILWSNVKTLKPAVFSRLPQPDVSRRFRDSDPVGRVAALILERALQYEIEHYPDYREAMNNAIEDRYLGGRGTAWVRYEPHLRSIEQEPADGYGITEDVEGAEQEPESAEYSETGQEIDYECSPCDYVHWRDFGHNVARQWEEVTTIWRRVYLGREALVERFGQDGEDIPLDTMPEELKKMSGAPSDNSYQALIYEVWDKDTNTAYWFSKSLNKIIDEVEDPLGLENFWPCPKPLFSTTGTDRLVPTPDFTLYQDQANALDVLADRIEGLITALQVKGVYDSSISELRRLFTEATNGEMIPVTNWMAFAEKNGLKGAIDIVDLAPIAAALTACYNAVNEQKQQIYEITGLSDIMRGQSDPRETLGAQRLKGQFGSMRLREMQDQVAHFATELLQIKAQIICGQFDPDTIAKIADVETLSDSDKPLIGPAIQLLKDKAQSKLRVSIAADSLVMMDEQQEKADRTEFLTAAGGFLKQAAEVGEQHPQLAPLLLDMLKFGIGGFKVGKTIEGSFDQLGEKLRLAAEQPQPEKPDPAAQKIQADLAMGQQQLQLDHAKHQDEMVMRAQEQQNMATIEQQRNQMEAMREEKKAQMDMQERQHDAELRARLAEMEKQLENDRAAQQEAFERWKVEFIEAAGIVKAQISAKASMDSSLVSAQTAASQEVTEEIGPDMMGAHNEAMSKIAGVLEAMQRPKQVIRDADGQIVGVQ